MQIDLAPFFEIFAKKVKNYLTLIHLLGGNPKIFMWSLKKNQVYISSFFVVSVCKNQSVFEWWPIRGQYFKISIDFTH